MSIAIITAALLTATPPAAGVPSGMLVPEQIAPMKTFSADALGAFVSEIGLQHTLARAGNGLEGIQAEAPNGVRFAMVPAACVEPGRCLGVWIGTTAGMAPAEDVFAFEQQVPFVNASILPSGEVGLWRYEICDGGYQPENLFYVVSNLVGIAKEFQDRTRQQLVVADPEGTLVDYSAGALNRQAAFRANFSQGTDGFAHEVVLPAGRAALFDLLGADARRAEDGSDVSHHLPR